MHRDLDGVDQRVRQAHVGQPLGQRLEQVDRLVGLGLPVLVGASRKSFLGRLLADADGTPRPAERRDGATLATTVMAAEAGVWGVRVHDAAASVDAVRTVEAVRAARAARRG